MWRRWKGNPKVDLSPWAEEAITDQYEITETLGHGGFGEVKLARHLRTQTTVAVKMVQKRSGKGKKWKTHVNHINVEAEILRSLDHPNVIQFMRVIDTTHYTYIITEHAAGGDLRRRVEELRHLHEAESRRIFSQLACALHYCHSKRIVHRDIKPENILFDRDGNVKLIDFGLSTKVDIGQKVRTCCGTREYWAPEIFKCKAYDAYAADIWSLGIVLYFMSIGYLPFPGYTYDTIKLGIEISMLSIRCKVSLELGVMISTLLSIDPGERPTIGDILGLSWLKYRDGSSLELPKEDTDTTVRVTMDVMEYSPPKLRAPSREADGSLKHAERPSIKKASSVPSIPTFVRTQPEVDVGRRHSMPPRPCLKKSTQAEKPCMLGGRDTNMSNTGSRTTPSRSILSWLWMFSSTTETPQDPLSGQPREVTTAVRPNSKNSASSWHRLHLLTREDTLCENISPRENISLRDTSRSSLSWSWMFSKSEDVATADSDKSKNSKSTQNTTPHLSREESSTTETPQEHLSGQPGEFTTAVRPNSKNSASSWHGLHLLTRDDSPCENINPQNRESHSWPTGTSKEHVRGQPRDVSTAVTDNSIARDEVDTENINTAGRDSGTLAPQSSAQQHRSPQGAAVPRAPLRRRIWKGLRVRAANCLRTLCCCCMPAHRRQHPGRNKMPVGNEDHGDSSENNHVEATDLPGP